MAARQPADTRKDRASAAMANGPLSPERHAAWTEDQTMPLEEAIAAAPEDVSDAPDAA
jgi:hypothetical protein